jgi:hypothetical protein
MCANAIEEYIRAHPADPMIPLPGPNITSLHLIRLIHSSTGFYLIYRQNNSLRLLSEPANGLEFGHQDKPTV